jgi:ATP-dependent Clp protease ATP-binding subunit ClpC
MRVGIVVPSDVSGRQGAAAGQPLAMQARDEPPDEEAVVRALRRLAPAATCALDLAQREAAAFGREYVGTEHLLIALAAGEGVAARVLAAIGLDADTLRHRVAFVGGQGNAQPAAPTELPLSPRLGRVLLAAEHDAAKRGQAAIGTVHLLIGLIKERAGVAVFLLHLPGVGLERIGSEIMHAIREGAKD